MKSYRQENLFSRIHKFTECPKYNCGYCIDTYKQGKYCLLLPGMPEQFKIYCCEMEQEIKPIKPKYCKNSGCAYHACISNHCQYVEMVKNTGKQWERECEKTDKIER
jgi:hypothetical protein